MTTRSSSAIQRNRSVTSSLTDTHVPIVDQKDTSTKNFAQSCPFRTADIDRNAIIKRQDMESCLKRLSTRDDVYGVIVATMDGRVLYECDLLKKWIPALGPLCSFARHLVRDNDPDDAIQALRLRTKTYEIIITIRKEQILIVMQMLSNNNMKDSTVDGSMLEEDWQAFLQRIQQQKIDNE